MYTPAQHVHCIGCSALVPILDGPTFRYLDAASPGCWALYGQILAREYGEFGYPPVHLLTVDAYMVQHPGRPTPQTVHSVTIHLISLCCVLERNYDTPRSTYLMRKAAERYKGAFTWLEPPPSRGAITVLDVLGASDIRDHQQRVKDWAESVWDAWSAHHATIRDWIIELENF